MPDPRKALHKYLLNEQTHEKVRSCEAEGTPARQGTPQLAKEGRLALSVPTQAALAAGRRILSRGAALSSSAVLSWKSPLTTSHLAVFQRLIDSVLSGLIYCTQEFADDVIINSLSYGVHLWR